DAIRIGHEFATTTGVRRDVRPAGQPEKGSASIRERAGRSLPAHQHTRPGRAWIAKPRSSRPATRLDSATPSSNANVRLPQQYGSVTTTKEDHKGRIACPHTIG